MKKLTGLILLMICFTGAFSQVKLAFCASVDPAGYCIFDNTKFIAAKDSTTGRLFMEVRSEGAPIGANAVVFKVYKVEGGKETFVTMLNQNIKPDWFFSWMPYVFNAPGKYTVKVYNENDQMICTNQFEWLAYK
jgi:hypothetical protein